MKKIILLLSLTVSIFSCKCQDYIDWIGQSYCTDNYGLLYNWYALNDSRNVANTDWHVMTPTERNQLLSDLGGTAVAGGALKESGLTYWDSPNTGATNSSGMNVRGSGYRSNNDGSYAFLKVFSYIWSYISSTPVVMRCIYNDDEGTTVANNRKDGAAVRLVYEGGGTPTEYIGNNGDKYRVVQVGSAYLTADNLRETKFRNGDVIPFHGTDNTSNFTNAEWAALTTSGVCAYNNDVSNVGCNFTFPIDYANSKYGYLYNWYATSGDSLSSSDDWVVPDYTELTTLRTSAGGVSVAGTTLKESGIEHWLSGNIGTNDYLFNARGSGKRNHNDGSFSDFKDYFYMWTRSEDSGYGYHGYTDRASIYFFINYNLVDKKTGHSVRLLYTGSGTPTSYTGNDGKVYRVVLIGTQYWLSENLCETKYRGGSTIPTVTDNTTWSGLTTGAKAAYDNDESNVR